MQNYNGKWKDTMQVCMNGHLINASFEKYPDRNKDYCAKCGQKQLQLVKIVKNLYLGKCIMKIQLHIILLEAPHQATANIAKNLFLGIVA